MGEETPLSHAVPSGCKCWMLRPAETTYREICEEFVAHEFLRVKDYRMCARCAHLEPCHGLLALLP